MTEVASWKTEKVEALTEEVTGSPVVALADVKGIPAPQLQSIRQSLRGKAKIIVSKKSLISHSLEKLAESRDGIMDLSEHMSGQIAFVLTEMNPFKLFKELEATKTQAPARGGEVSPEDILVKEGDTPFKPGPVMSELQRAGLPASIEGGKVVIKKDTVLVKRGDTIPREVAQVLTRLEIYPITVGLDLTGVYEDGTIFSPDDLRIDEVEFMGELTSAIGSAANLAMFVGYVTDVTVKPLIVQAETRALNLAMFTGISTKRTVELLIQKAHTQMMALSTRIPDSLEEEPKDEPEKVEEAEPEEAEAEPEEKEEATEEAESEPETKDEDHGGE